MPSTFQFNNIIVTRYTPCNLEYGILANGGGDDDDDDDEMMVMMMMILAYKLFNIIQKQRFSY